MTEHWARTDSAEHDSDSLSITSLWIAFARNGGLDFELPVIRFLRQRPNTLITAEGIAAQLGRPLQAIQDDLGELQELGLVRQTQVAGISFYGLERGFA